MNHLWGYLRLKRIGIEQIGTEPQIAQRAQMGGGRTEKLKAETLKLGNLVPLVALVARSRGRLNPASRSPDRPELT
jgi:hypothetical protein